MIGAELIRPIPQPSPDRHGSPRRLGRRLVGVGIAAFIALGPSACGVLSEVYPQGPGKDAYLATCDELSPYEAAGAVIIDIKSAKMSGIGHAGIYQKDNELFLVSVEHVIGELEADATITATVCGKNGETYEGTTTPPKETILLSERKSTDDDVEDFDSIMAIPLREFGNEINQAVINGDIKPLTIRTNEQLAEGESLGLVDADGSITKMSKVEVSDDEDHGFLRHGTQLNGDKVCQGQSGASILVFDSYGNATGEAVGQINGTRIYDPLNIAECGYDLFFIPFKPSI